MANKARPRFFCWKGVLAVAWTVSPCSGNHGSGIPPAGRIRPPAYAEAQQQSEWRKPAAGRNRCPAHKTTERVRFAGCCIRHGPRNATTPHAQVSTKSSAPPASITSPDVMPHSASQIRHWLFFTRDYAESRGAHFVAVAKIPRSATGLYPSFFALMLTVSVAELDERSRAPAPACIVTPCRPCPGCLLLGPD